MILLPRNSLTRAARACITRVACALYGIFQCLPSTVLFSKATLRPFAACTSISRTKSKRKHNCTITKCSCTQTEMLMDKNNKKRVREDIEAEEKRGQTGRISEKVTSTSLPWFRSFWCTSYSRYIGQILNTIHHRRDLIHPVQIIVRISRPRVYDFLLLPEHYSFTRGSPLIATSIIYTYSLGGHLTTRK